MDEQHQSVTINHVGRSRTLTIRTDRYRHGGGLAVELIDESDTEFDSYADVSINFGFAGLADDEFVFKTYSENEGLLEAMLGAGVIEKIGREVQVGMAGPQPICRLLKKSN